MPRGPLQEPPLSPRQCAEYMGVTSQFVRNAITRGVRVGETTVFLPSECLRLNGRRLYRIHADQYAAFLRAIGWQHLPRASRGALDDPVRPVAP